MTVTLTKWTDQDCSDLSYEALRDYLTCALWSTYDCTVEDAQHPLDQEYDWTDVSGALHTDSWSDLEGFVLWMRDAGHLAEYLERQGIEQLGHDFWLTRNHHGAGFWGRGLGALGDELSSMAGVYGTVNLYVGDDGFVHGM